MIQTFNRFAIQLDYMANKNEYAKNCENKAKPMLHCNGQCQMMKKMKEQEKKDQQMPEKKQNKVDEAFSSKSFFYTIIFHSADKIKSITAIASGHVVDRSFAFFHPPQIS